MNLKKDCGFEESIYEILIDLYNLECSKIFRFPVDPEVDKCPTYYDVIKNPMDLSTLKLNFKDGKYENVDQILDDLNLMVANCRLFNPPYNPIIKILDKFQSCIQARWKKIESLTKQFSTRKLQVEADKIEQMEQRKTKKRDPALPLQQQPIKKIKIEPNFNLLLDQKPNPTKISFKSSFQFKPDNKDIFLDDEVSPSKDQIPIQHKTLEKKAPVYISPAKPESSQPQVTTPKLESEAQLPDLKPQVSATSAIDKSDTSFKISFKLPQTQPPELKKAQPPPSQPPIPFQENIHTNVQQQPKPPQIRQETQQPPQVYEQIPIKLKSQARSEIEIEKTPAVTPTPEPAVPITIAKKMEVEVQKTPVKSEPPKIEIKDYVQPVIMKKENSKQSADHEKQTFTSTVTKSENETKFDEPPTSLKPKVLSEIKDQKTLYKFNKEEVFTRYSENVRHKLSRAKKFIQKVISNFQASIGIQNQTLQKLYPDFKFVSLQLIEQGLKELTIPNFNYVNDSGAILLVMKMYVLWLQNNFMKLVFQDLQDMFRYCDLVIRALRVIHLLNKRQQKLRVGAASISKSAQKDQVSDEPLPVTPIVRDLLTQFEREIQNEIKFHQKPIQITIKEQYVPKEITEHKVEQKALTSIVLPKQIVHNFDEEHFSQKTFKNFEQSYNEKFKSEMISTLFSAQRLKKWKAKTFKDRMVEEAQEVRPKISFEINFNKIKQPATGQFYPQTFDSDTEKLPQFTERHLIDTTTEYVDDDQGERIEKIIMSIESQILPK